MTREEAIKLIEHISITFVPTDQYGDYDDPQPYEEALDMAIEALQNLSKPNNGFQGSDLISRQDAIRWVKTECNPYGKPTLDFESGKKVIEHLEQMPSADEQDDNRLYIKIYADDEPSVMAEKLYQICGETQNGEVAKWLKEYFPSAEPKTMNKTNANKIYSYLKERIGDTVDDMKEFDAWFERMVWHVKECDRLAKEPKTEWIPVSDGLPSDSGNYLITVSDLRLGHNGEHTVTMADFYAKAKKWNSVVDVLAWKPLPEPWKDGEEE